MAQTGRPCHCRHFCWAALVWTARAGNRNQGRPPRGRQAPGQLGPPVQHLRQWLAHSRSPADPQTGLEVGPEGALKPRVARWDLDPVLALCEEKPRTQTFLRRLPALEHWLKNGYSTGLAREICPWTVCDYDTHVPRAGAHRIPAWTRPLPQEPQEEPREEAANYMSPFCICARAQRQCTQAPGDINILIPVSHADEGGRCHCPRMLTTEDESLLKESGQEKMNNKRAGGRLGRGRLGTKATARLRCQADRPRAPHQAGCPGLRPETVGVEFKSRAPGRYHQKRVRGHRAPLRRGSGALSEQKKLTGKDQVHGTPTPPATTHGLPDESRGQEGPRPVPHRKDIHAQTQGSFRRFSD